MKNCVHFTAAAACLLLFSACKTETELKDFVGDYNTAYSESVETIDLNGYNKIHFSELMPVKIKIFNDAQTNMIIGEMRLNYHTHVHISLPLKSERFYEMKNFRILADTLEFSMGDSGMTAQIVKSSVGNVFGIEKKFIQWGDFRFLLKNPLYKSETSKMIYYKIPEHFNEEQLTEEFYNIQINEWKSELQNPKSKSKKESQTYIDYLTNRLKE